MHSQALTNVCLFHIVGMYNMQVGQASYNDCLACPVAKFCNETGLSTPVGDCAGGFLCLLGAHVPMPNDGVNGPCPVGHYCPEGRDVIVSFMKRRG